MTHPDHGELSFQAIQILRDADRAFEPTPADKQRLRARLAKAAAGSSVPSPSAAESLPESPPSAPAPATTGAEAAAKSPLFAQPWVLKATILSLGLGAGYLVGRLHGATIEAERLRAAHRSAVDVEGQETRAPAGPSKDRLSTAPRNARIEEPIATPQGDSAAARASSPAERPREDHRPTPVARNATDPGSSMRPVQQPSTETAHLVRARSLLLEETYLLRLAQQALHEGNTERARELLAEGDAKFPQGALVQDRAAARVLLLCSLGRSEHTRTAALSFLDHYPQSVHRQRIENACTLQATAPTKPR